MDDKQVLWQPLAVSRTVFQSLPWDNRTRSERAGRDAAIAMFAYLSRLVVAHGLTPEATWVYEPDQRGGDRFGIKVPLDMYIVSASTRLSFDVENDRVILCEPIGLYSPPTIDPDEPFTSRDIFAAD